jgi:hypothetical protein
MRVLIAPTIESSDRVLDHLLSWSRSGLVEPFCWWPTDVASVDDVSLDVMVVRRGEITHASLSDALEHSDPEDIAFVAACASRADEDLPASFANAVRARLTAASRVLAFAAERPLQAAMVVVPASVGQPVAPDLFSLNWMANLYVAPEDRATPSAVSHLAANPGTFGAHAAHAIAALADIWDRGALRRDSVLEQLGASPPGTDQPLVQVVRCYSRTVDFGYLPDHVAAAVFKLTGEWPVPDPERFDPVPDPRETLDYVTDSYLLTYREVLGLSDFQAIPLPKFPKLGLWEAIKRLFFDFVRRAARIPYDVVESLAETAYEIAKAHVEALAGPDSDIRVLGWRESPGTPVEKLERLEAHLDGPLVVEDGPVMNAWIDLRRLTFGLIDGSQLPRGVDESKLTRGRKRVVVTNPRLIVPDPQNRPPENAGIEDPRACDPLHLDPRFAELLDPPPEETEDGFPPLAPKPELWVEPNRGLPVWRVGEAIAEAILAAHTGSTVDPDAAVRGAAAAAAARRRAARERRARILWAAAQVAVLAIAGYVAWVKLESLPRTGALVLAGAATLAALASLAYDLWQARDGAARAELCRVIEALNAALRRAQLRCDEIRLRQRYREYLDWAETVGWLSHHPWIGQPLNQVDLRASVDQRTLPAAFGVAVARTQTRLDLLERQARASLFRPKWLANFYSPIEKAITERLGEEDERLVGRDPSADTSAGPLSARGRLTGAMRRGDHRHVGDNALVHGLLQFIAGIPIDQAADGVVDPRHSGGGGEPLPPSAAWFSPPANLPELAQALRPTVVRLEVGTMDGDFGGSGVVVSASGQIATARHVVEHAEHIRVLFSDGSDATATVALRAANTDIALLTIDDDLPHAFAALAPPAEPISQGDPVITLGFPRMLQGEPTLAWGLITATDRSITLDEPPPGIERFGVIQATYHSASGASGAPVFDLHGRVVGVHCAGAREIQGDDKAVYLSSAIPVSDLKLLLAGGGAIEDALGDADLAPVPARPMPRASAPMDAATATPSAYLTALVRPELMPPTGSCALLHEHWLRPDDDEQVVTRVLQTPTEHEGDAGRIGALSGVPRLLVPLRATRCRIDVTRAQPMSALTSCAAEPREPNATLARA